VRRTPLSPTAPETKTGGPIQNKKDRLNGGPGQSAGVGRLQGGIYCPELDTVERTSLFHRWLRRPDRHGGNDEAALFRLWREKRGEIEPETTHADPLYPHLIVTAERKFWPLRRERRAPRLYGVDPPRPRIDAVRIVEMSDSNSWADFAALFRDTR
jgi:hypothetical protein